MTTKHYDVVIVGGGPAGLTAAIYSARSNLKTIVLEKGTPGGELLRTTIIEDYPGFHRIFGAELAMKMEEQAREFGAEFVQATVTQIRNRSKEKHVVTEAGDRYRTSAVIVCTGGSPKRLRVPGEEEFAGRGVSYCAVCDGPFFRGKTIAVVGGGDSAVGEAEYLTRFASKVYLVNRAEGLQAKPALVNQLLENPRVSVINHSAMQTIEGDEVVETVGVKNLKTGKLRRLNVSGVFVYVGFKPNAEVMPEEVLCDDGGYVLTDWHMQTTSPGIFAAGDVRAESTRQITNAVGDATSAAIQAYHYLDSIHALERPKAVAK